MRIIGITGTMGSGKSEILRYVVALGAKVIDSDQITRELSEPGQALYRALVREFGKGILQEDGQLNKALLRERIFSNPKDLNRINEVSRDLLISVIIKRVMAMRDKDTVVIEAIRLYETGLNRICDEVWYVYCEKERQIQRIGARSDLSPEQIASILGSQQNIADMIERADHVIDNSGTLEETKKQIDKLYREES